jgi:hypothetical protein
VGRRALVIEILFALALTTAVPLGALITIDQLRDEPRRRTWSTGAVVVGAFGAVIALALGRGPGPALLVVPWFLVTVGIAIGAGWSVLRPLIAGRVAIEPWRLGVAAAVAFLAVGAGWAVIDRAGLRPFGFGTTIVLLTAVHFHVAGFVLTLAGSLAARRRPGFGIDAALVALIIGTPLTALGFFGLPVVSWVGALLVATSGIGIGLTTIAVSRRSTDGIAGSALLLGGATLLLTMPLAAAYATGTTFGIPFLDIPAMAAIHGGLNVVGFAIPAMAGWRRLAR